MRDIWDAMGDIFVCQLYEIIVLRYTMWCSIRYNQSMKGLLMGWSKEQIHLFT